MKWDGMDPWYKDGNVHVQMRWVVLMSEALGSRSLGYLVITLLLSGTKTQSSALVTAVIVNLTVIGMFRESC